MHLPYNIHRIRPSKFRPQNDQNTHTPKTNSEYCIFRDKCILRLKLLKKTSNLLLAIITLDTFELSLFILRKKSKFRNAQKSKSCSLCSKWNYLFLHERAKGQKKLIWTFFSLSLFPSLLLSKAATFQLQYRISYSMELNS